MNSKTLVVTGGSLCAGLALLLSFAFFVIVSERETNANIARFPAISLADAVREDQLLEKLVSAPFDEARTYHELLRRCHLLEMRTLKTSLMESSEYVKLYGKPFTGNETTWMKSLSMTARHDLTEKLRMSFKGSPDTPEFIALAKETMHIQFDRPVKLDYSRPLSLFVLGVLFIWIFTYWYMALDLCERKCSWLVAVSTVRFWLSGLLGPFGARWYLRDMNPVRQWQAAQARIVFCICTVLGCGGGAGAQTGRKGMQENKVDASYAEVCRADYSGRARNYYLGPLVGDDFYSDWVYQSSLNLSCPGSRNWAVKGLSLNVWSSATLNTRPLGSGYGSEGDVSIFWNGMWKGWKIGLGATYLNVYPLSKVPHGDVVNASQRISRQLKVSRRHSIEPYVQNVLTAPVKGDSPGAGIITHAGVDWTWQIASRVSVNVRGYGVHDSGAFGLSEGYLAIGGIDPAIRLTRRLTLHPAEIRGILPVSVKDGRIRRVGYGFGIDYSFGF